MHGDSRLVEETSKAFKKDKKLVKGIAFPTCISVNNCICHFSPLTTEPDVTLADGDLVKIDLGAHIDGFIAVVAHTLVVGASGHLLILFYTNTNTMKILTISIFISDQIK